MSKQNGKVRRLFSRLEHLLEDSFRIDDYENAQQEHASTFWQLYQTCREISDQFTGPEPYWMTAKNEADSLDQVYKKQHIAQLAPDRSAIPKMDRDRPVKKEPSSSSG